MRQVTKSQANFADGRIDSVLDIDEDIPPPKALGNSSRKLRAQLSVQFIKEGR
jgi:hypothetical protein